MTANQHAWAGSLWLLVLMTSPFGCGDDQSPSDAGASSHVSGAAGKGSGVAGTPGADAGAATQSSPSIGLADGIVGKACDANADCGNGSCQKTIAVVNTSYPGGYCSGRCLNDAACGANGVCVPGILGGVGSCFLRCDEASGCQREGYRCRVVSNVGRCVAAPVPLPDHVVGNACESDAACGGGTMSCASMLGSLVAPGGYCSQACAIDPDCGAGGMCINGINIVTIASGRCYRTCSGPEGCRAEYECRSINGLSSGPAVCTPRVDGDAGTN
jgi:hypothetical protein